MKKITLTSALFFLALLGFAQSGIKVGIKVAPALSFARVIDKDDDDGVNFSSNGSSFGLAFGPYFDFPVLKENVYFTTGLWFSIKSAKVTTNVPSTLLSPGGYLGSSKYNLQYLTVPVFFKFYTNEVAQDVKIYFQMGGTVDFKISENTAGTDGARLKSEAQDENKSLFLFVDGNLLLGTGVQFKVGSTTLLAGVSYCRGLVNIVNPTLSVNDKKAYQYVAVKNNLVSLDLGIEF